MVLNETDRKTRDERLSQLVKYCMISGALDLNLYAEYDVKEKQDVETYEVQHGTIDMHRQVTYQPLCPRTFPFR